MKTDKEKFLEGGWQSIGFDREVEYLAKETDHDEIMFIPIYQGEALGNVMYHQKDLIKLLSSFISHEVSPDERKDKL